MTDWIEEKARARCEEYEAQADQFLKAGQPVQARTARALAGVLRTLFEGVA